MNFDAGHWLAYREANMRFADVVAQMASEGDIIWVQDYHLMLLPMLLRSILSGESAQGEMVRRELGRVKKGVDDGIVKGVLGMEPGIADANDDFETLGDVVEEGIQDSLTMTTRRTPSGAGQKRPAFTRGISGYQRQELAAKQRGKGNIKIGFFLHTPFPSSEIYRWVGFWQR